MGESPRKEPAQRSKPIQEVALAEVVNGAHPVSSHHGKSTPRYRVLVSTRGRLLQQVLKEEYHPGRGQKQ